MEPPFAFDAKRDDEKCSDQKHGVRQCACEGSILSSSRDNKYCLDHGRLHVSPETQATPQKHEHVHDVINRNASRIGEVISEGNATVLKLGRIVAFPAG